MTQGIVFGAFFTVIAFYPLLDWLVDATSQNTQLLHSFLILSFAGVLLIFEKRESINFSRSLDRPTISGIALSTAFVVSSKLSGIGVLYIPALVIAVYTWCHYLFGHYHRRLYTALIAAFAIFLVFILIFPGLDWPLRMLAGKWANGLFNWLGWESQLLLAHLENGETKLILTSNARPFEVAPECNGGGILSASALLAVLLAVYKKTSVWRGVILLLVSITLALIFNLLRILIIVFLAPHVGEHYFLMHEIIGISTLWIGLFVVWTAGKRFAKAPI